MTYVSKVHFGQLTICLELSDNNDVTLGPSFESALSAARKGAAWAFEAIYRDLAPAVLGYIRGQGGAEPEDLASEVFVGLVRGLGRFEGDERAFRTWVFTIAHRRLVDERRRLGRRLEEPTDPAEMSRLATGALVPAVEEDVVGMFGSGVERAMKALSYDQRAVLLLRILADLSVAEVASILGKSQGAVKTLQRRGLRSLVRQLEGEGVS
jgi:RNA polymerase sigma factor (sigma-70 family)